MKTLVEFTFKSFFGLPLVRLGLWMILPALTVVSVMDVHARKSTGDSGLSALQYKQGDEDGNDVKAAKAEWLAAKSEKLAVKQVKALLRKYRGTVLEADLQFRLAELYMRQSKSARFFELHRKKSFVSLIPQEVTKGKSRRVIKKAINIYELIGKRFPNYEKSDLVLFNNAFARQSLGETKTAEARYWRLVKSYPHSYLVPDSHLAIGEMAFARNKYKHALEHFDAVKKYPKSRVYPYGLYKAAWTHYNLHNTKQAMLELEGVIDFGKKVAANKWDARLDLRKEALVDLTLFFEDQRPAKQAFGYFANLAEEEELIPTLMSLNSLYKRHSRFRDRATLLERILDEERYSQWTAQIHENLIENYESQKNRVLAVKQMKLFAKDCQKNSRLMRNLSPIGVSKGSKVSGKEKLDVVADCGERISEQSLRLARKWQRFWKRFPKEIVFAQSSQVAFEVYLQLNKDNKLVKDYQMVRYAYAELLFKQGNYKQASFEYEAVAEKVTDKKIKHDSFYASLVSWEKSVKSIEGDEKAQKRFLKLAKEYLSKYAKGKYNMDLEFKVGLIAYAQKDYAAAKPLFRKLGKSNGNQARALRAQDLLLDILSQEKDYAAIKSYASELIKAKPADLRYSKLAKIYQESYFLEVQQLEKDKKWQEAAREYKKFAKQNRKSELADKAYWNAIHIDLDHGSIVRGAKTALEYTEIFPESKRIQEALELSAAKFEIVGHLAAAASVMEKMASRDPANAMKWMMMAANYYRIDNKTDRGQKILRGLASKGTTTQRYEVLVELLGQARATGDHRQERRHLEDLSRYGERPESLRATMYFIKEDFSLKKYSKVFADTRKIVALKSAPADVRAEARFLQAQILEGEFRRQSVKAKAERVAMVIALKTEKLDKAQRAYQAVVRFGAPKLAVKALVNLADCYAHYVQSLNTMPLPAGLSPADEKVFRQEISNLTIPIEEKGVDSLQSALNVAKRAELVDGTVGEVSTKLSQLNQRKLPVDLLSVESPRRVVPIFKGVGS